jgi:hypothetical protein
MKSFALPALVGLVALLSLFAAPAEAFQCPKLVKQLQDQTARRFDATAASAKVAAQQAQALHAAGNHAESEKVAKEALNKLGVKS